MKYVQVIPTLSLAKSSIFYFSNIGLKGVSDRKTCLITINLMKLTAQQHINSWVAVVDVTRLTGWIKPGESFQLNIQIWIL